MMVHHSQAYLLHHVVLFPLPFVGLFCCFQPPTLKMRQNLWTIVILFWTSMIFFFNLSGGRNPQSAKRGTSKKVHASNWQKGFLRWRSSGCSSAGKWHTCVSETKKLKISLVWIPQWGAVFSQLTHIELTVVEVMTYKASIREFAWSALHRKTDRLNISGLLNLMITSVTAPLWGEMQIPDFKLGHLCW